MDNKEKEIKALLKKLRSLSLLRDELDRDIFETQKVKLESRLRSLGGAQICGNVTAHRDFIGRDQNIIINGVYVGEPPQADEHRLAVYREVVANRCGQLPLRGFHLSTSDPSSDQAALNLARVYIGLNTRVTAPVQVIDKALKEASLGRPPGLNKNTTEQSHLAEKSRSLSALEAVIVHPCLVLLGDPGSGKTTFVNRLAQALALGDAKHLEAWPRSQRAHLPIVVVLRDFASWITTRAKDSAASPHLLWSYIVHELKEHNVDFAKGLLEQELQQGRAVVLLDGLDEVSTKTALERVRDSIIAFAGRYPGSRYLVSCRVLSYQQPQWKLPEDRFPHLELAPFDDGQIDRFIEAWYVEVSDKWQMPCNKADNLASKLKQAVRRSDLWRLAPNPMLLTVMALVHAHQGELPEARARLYEQAVDILLWRWEQHKRGHTARLTELLRQAGRDQGDLLSLLERLAFEAHGRQGGEGADQVEGEDVVAGIGELELLKALQVFHPQKSLDWAQAVVDTLKLRAGLLVERQPSVFTFPHRTFQEYLAGAHLTHSTNFGLESAALVEARGLWREVILLAVGYLVYNQREYERPLALVEQLCPPASKPPCSEDGWRKIWLAGEVLLEMGINRVEDTAQGLRLLARARRQLNVLLEAKALPLRELVEAGDVLGRLGDPRRGVGVLPAKNDHPSLPDIDWVEIPEGSFTMGSDPSDEQAQDVEQPAHVVELPAFCISRYPVTNIQYRPFIDNGGYDDPNWWTEEGWAWRQGSQADVSFIEDKDLRSAYTDWLAKRPREKRHQPFYWGDTKWCAPTRPVVGICWFEALAYCRWLSKQLDAAIGLPSEAQWEKAARGTDGRLWPWGNTWEEARANTEEAKLGQTSPVGLFTQNASPYGVQDMAGNVWEWTTTHWGRSSVYRPDYAYPYKLDDGRESLQGLDLRVVRGGSWDNDRRRSRCAVRGRVRPEGFDGGVGFRVVLSLADSEC